MKQFTIFQIKDDAANSRYVKFTSYELLQDMGVKLSLDMYENIYEGQIEAEEGETIYETLEHIFMVLNIGRKPEGYKGHSLSVSDVVMMDGVYYYVDGMGFQEVNLGVEIKARKQAYTILIMNTDTLKRERKNFESQEEADAYYEKRKSSVELAFPEKPKWFSYKNEFGRMMHVQKMY